MLSLARRCGNKRPVGNLPWNAFNWNVNKIINKTLLLKYSEKWNIDFSWNEWIIIILCGIDSSGENAQPTPW